METKSILDEQITRLVEFLLFTGYAPRTVKHYSCYWNRFRAYANKQGCESFSTMLGNSFLQDEYGVKDIEHPAQKEKESVRAIKMLKTFLASGKIAEYQKRCTDIPMQFDDIYSRYIKHLHSLGQKPESTKTKQSRIRLFLNFVSNEKIECIEALTKSSLLHFMAHLKSKYSSVGRGNILYTVKDFLKFCASENFIDGSVPLMIKGIFTNPNETLPSVYSIDEIKVILQSVDRNTSEGKRDYAILLLATILGLRSSDIINLQLNDIKWSSGTIEFIQKKTGLFTQLPLPENLKHALADYIENGRQAAEYGNLFLRARAPITPYNGTVTIYNTVSKYIKVSGILIGQRNRGPHSLRHSMASGMLENKTSLPVIASALGHSSTKNTGRYIRIDIELLRSVALEVPK